MRRFVYFAILFSFVFTGCAKNADDQTTPVPSASAPASTAAKTVDPATAGVLKGRVTFSGQAPAPREIGVAGNPECAVFHPGGKILSDELLIKNGAVQNVFVYVKSGLDDYRFAPPTEPAVISNKNCMYSPHVSGVQVGQPVTLLNEDPTLHNMHSYSKNSKSWNLGLPFQGMKQTKHFDAPEVMVMLKCDVHPWMTGYVGVLPHPYFAVTGENGEFELKNLPPGKYTVEAWQEKLGARSQEIDIGPHETKSIEFNFS